MHDGTWQVRRSVSLKHIKMAYFTSNVAMNTCAAYRSPTYHLTQVWHTQTPPQILLSPIPPPSPAFKSPDVSHPDNLPRIDTASSRATMGLTFSLLRDAST